jgi:hypothetical protein
MLFITWSDWLAAGRRRFGDDIADWAFICPVCGRRQTIRDFEKKSIPYAFAHVYHRCISFFEKDSLCGFGCSDQQPQKISWTPSITRRLHEVEVLHSARYVPAFKFAKPAVNPFQGQGRNSPSFKFDRPCWNPKRPLFPSAALTACAVPDHCGGWKIRDGHGWCFGAFNDKKMAEEAIKENGWMR